MAQGTDARSSSSQRHRYIGVRDSCNRKVRALWQRNGAYYVQLWLEGERSPRRFRAKATTLVEKRLVAGNTPRTLNLNVIMLRDALNRALDAGYIQVLPTQGMRSPRVLVPQRELLTPENLAHSFRLAKVPVAIVSCSTTTCVS